MSMHHVTLAALYWIAGMASANTVTLTASKDNTLIELNAGLVSNGIGDGIFAGRLGSNGMGLRDRGVVAFSLAGVVPAGAVVTNATLTLTFLQSVSGDQPVTVHRVLADWGESGSESGGGAGDTAEPGDATWIHTFYPLCFWTNPGGDFDPNPSATQTVGNLSSPIIWTSRALIADVQSWVNNPASNFGWLIRGNEAASFTVKKFASREYKDVPSRPQLTITFTPPSCPADIAPPGGNGQVNVDDLLVVINSWGSCPAPCPPHCVADIAPPGGNCMVNVDDLLAVINSWGACH